MGLRGLFSNPPDGLGDLLFLFNTLSEKPKTRMKKG
jgi:hypothetical protein